MLDLMTLGLSMGAQEDLEKMREESGVSTVIQEDQAQNTATPAPVAAVANLLEGIESAASSAVAALMPSASVSESIASIAQAPTFDLSLPTAAKKS